MVDVVVTGAAGKTGLTVLRALTARGASVRALVRHDGQRERVEGAGAVETRVADLADRGAMESAFGGAGAVYYICPNLRPNEGQLGRLAIAAARDTGTGRFVYHSVLHPQAEKMPHHWQKLRVEEALFESGLDWTVLQPTAYMENLLAGWGAVVGEGLFRVPYPAGSRIALVALQDVGEVAARVVTEAGHAGATYELVGTEPLTQHEVAEALTGSIGRPVRAVAIPARETRAALEGRGLDPYEVGTLMKMFDYYRRYGLEGNPRVLGWLLGRPPTTLAEFVQGHTGRIDG